MKLLTSVKRHPRLLFCDRGGGGGGQRTDGGIEYSRKLDELDFPINFH